MLTSRGDSTLRGHYPAETDALREALGADFDGVILCHCYLETGRITVEERPLGATGRDARARR